ncbi:MAG: hypothetical protein ACLQGJ_10290, partial [Candidatus Dormibacteria bacterium]
MTVASVPAPPVEEAPPVPEPDPPPPPDTRQRWVCVDPEGPRHKVRVGRDLVPCPPFHSDAHAMHPPELVRCPSCGS